MGDPISCCAKDPLPPKALRQAHVHTGGPRARQAHIVPHERPLHTLARMVRPRQHGKAPALLCAVQSATACPPRPQVGHRAHAFAQPLGHGPVRATLSCQYSRGTQHSALPYDGGRLSVPVFAARRRDSPREQLRCGMQLPHHKRAAQQSGKRQKHQGGEERAINETIKRAINKRSDQSMKRAIKHASRRSRHGVTEPASLQACQCS
jgi:hypothetical protein